MNTPTAGTLGPAGTGLYHEVRGDGPVLLIIPSGNGDAAPFGPIADALADRYTVITYDRRGFSRSPLEGPVDDERRLETDTDDIAALLDHFAGEPAHVFGSSSGAIVALALLERHPDRLRTLVAHEPPLASVVADSARWFDFHERLYETYRHSGVSAAKHAFRDGMGMGETTRPPVQPPPDQLAEMLSRIRRNHVFWFEHELRTYPAFVPDVEVLRSYTDRLVLAGGCESHEYFPYRPNEVLADRIGTGIVDLPGGHVGYVTHPAEFAEQLASLLGSRTAFPQPSGPDSTRPATEETPPRGAGKDH